MDHLPTQLNPLVSNDIWCMRIMLPTVLEPLLTLSTGGGIIPRLASKVEMKRGGRILSITLRPGVQFHDGRPLTSTDVKFTLDKLRTRNSPSRLLKIELADLTAVRAPRPDHVDLILRRTNYLFPYLLAEIPILPAHLHGRFGIRNTNLNAAPIGTGPFKIAERPDKETLVLTPNKHYWGTPARLDEIRYRSISDPAKALTALRNGELEVLSRLHPGYYPEQLKTPRIKKRFRALRLHPYRLRLLTYNLRKRSLQDRRVRRALDHLINREEMIRQITNGLGKRLSAPLWSLSRNFEQKIHPYPYDRHRAAKLLDAAGWSSKGGKRSKQGHPLAFTLLYSRGSPAMDKAARIIKKEFTAAGVALKIEAADFGFIQARMRYGRFDLTLMGLAPTPEADLSVLFHSRGRLNYGAYSRPLVDSLLESIRRTPRLETRQSIYRRLHRILHEELPSSVLFAPIEVMVVSRRIKGLANNGRWPRMVNLSLGAEVR